VTIDELRWRDGSLARMNGHVYDHVTESSRARCRNHSLLRQMAAQKQKTQQYKLKNKHKYRKKLKEKQQNQSEYASKASINNPIG